MIACGEVTAGGDCPLPGIVRGCSTNRTIDAANKGDSAVGLSRSGKARSSVVGDIVGIGTASIRDSSHVRHAGSSRSGGINDDVLVVRQRLSPRNGEGNIISDGIFQGCTAG